MLTAAGRRDGGQQFDPRVQGEITGRGTHYHDMDAIASPITSGSAHLHREPPGGKPIRTHVEEKGMQASIDERPS
jgi:hypothetical protein